MSLYIQRAIKEGVALNERLRKEYPEIQNMCSAINTMRMNREGKGNVQLTNICDELKENLKIDRFGILIGVLIKHKVISDIKEFIQEIT